MIDRNDVPLPVTVLEDEAGLISVAEWQAEGTRFCRFVNQRVIDKGIGRL